jgi:uncharacterized membrane protein (UPF0127 family)
MRADWHENRRLNNAMRGFENAAAGLSGLMSDLKLHTESEKMRERKRGASLKLASLFAFLPALIGATYASETCALNQSMHIHIGAQTFKVDLAATPAAREKGLSGHAPLTAENGMWFSFPTPDWYGFWMREMNFPIDLVWVSHERRVLGTITLQPCLPTESCRIHTPPSPVAFVLEINAGAFAGKAGDEVTWSCTR